MDKHYQQVDKVKDFTIPKQQSDSYAETTEYDNNKEQTLERIKEGIINIIPIIGLLVLWHIIAIIVMQIRNVPFPTPMETFIRFFDLIAGKEYLEHTIYGHLFVSLIRWGVGFILAVILGMIMGILAGWSKIVSKLLMPVVYILQPIPSLAWIPVAILLFGLGAKSTIFIIFLAALFPVVINVDAGVKGVNKMYIRAARMMGVNDRALFFKVLLPAAVPHLLSGFRVGLANGWRALIAAEMIAAAGSGLGYAIFQARWNFDYASAFVNIILICIIGLTIERFVFTNLEARTIERWGMKRKEG